MHVLAECVLIGCGRKRTWQTRKRLHASGQLLATEDSAQDEDQNEAETKSDLGVLEEPHFHGLGALEDAGVAVRGVVGAIEGALTNRRLHARHV